MLLINRRKFLLVSVFGQLCVAGKSWTSYSSCPRLVVQHSNWLEIPYEEELFEIAGSTEQGQKAHPNLKSALIVEARRLLQVQLVPESVLNVQRIDGCGLFTVYVYDAAGWRKFWFWNYIDSALPDYPVTRASCEVCLD